MFLIQNQELVKPIFFGYKAPQVLEKQNDLEKRIFFTPVDCFDKHQLKF